jgi:hypothetical protein
MARLRLKRDNETFLHALYASSLAFSGDEITTSWILTTDEYDYTNTNLWSPVAFGFPRGIPSNRNDKETRPENQKQKLPKKESQTYIMANRIIRCKVSARAERLSVALDE